MVVDVSSLVDDIRKVVADKDDKSGSDMDLDDLRMIHEGITQLEVRMEGGSRTITILMGRDLLQNTEELVPALGPLCSNAEGVTLKEINIAGLSLKVSIVVICPFPFCLNLFLSFDFCPLFLICIRSFWR